MPKPRPETASNSKSNVCGEQTWKETNVDAPAFWTPVVFDSAADEKNSSMPRDGAAKSRRTQFRNKRRKPAILAQNDRRVLGQLRPEQFQASIAQKS
jgi:hypothetical protein